MIMKTGDGNTLTNHLEFAQFMLHNAIFTPVCMFKQALMLQKLNRENLVNQWKIFHRLKFALYNMSLSMFVAVDVTKTRKQTPKWAE